VDHILFVLGIFLLSTAWRPILLQVTTFTIAHSITLGLTMYGIVSLPSSIVEPLIALSITYVAVENLWTTELKPWRLALVFMFGLLHGMGFAGVLRGLGLPRSEFLTALLTFNLGVEGGQLCGDHDRAAARRLVRGARRCAIGNGSSCRERRHCARRRVLDRRARDRLGRGNDADDAIVVGGGTAAAVAIAGGEVEPRRRVR